MALSDLSFKLYTNSALTASFGGTYTLLHKTDLSDNSQVLGPLYFGSINGGMSTTILQAASNPGIDNIVLTPTDATPVWTASTVYTLGAQREPTVRNGYRYEVSTAGTSGATQPTWPIGIGSFVTDGTVQWINRGPHHSPNELKIATTEAGLDTAVAGASLSLGTTLTSGVGNAVQLWIKVTNAVTIVSDAGVPEINISINSVREEVAP